MAAQVKNCIWVDRQLFDVGGKARPGGWQDVMHTVMTLQYQEERMSEQLRANRGVWFQMQLGEHNENWMEYDFARNPTLLDNMGSLLVQLKSLT